ncbi:MAG: sulfotransferase [Nitrospinota bacterium]|nr:sulfotransferase [Nitrospinota bacterium]
MVNKEIITVVSGLPRSGTSMMMKMLEAGGMEIMKDGIRKADDDNPNGYYEFEKAKELEKDTSWLKDAKGKVVKIISALLEHLPEKYNYKIIFMHRNMDEILNSQRQMLIRRGEPTDEVSDEKMNKMFLKHLQTVEEKLKKKSNIDVLPVHYNEFLKEPETHSKIVNQFLKISLNADNMVSVVDHSLYRQRKKS